MGNARQKGARTVRRAIEFYQERGWLVDTVEKTGRFRKHKDLYSNDDFGGFDLVCIKRNKTLLVQCKTNTPPTQRPYISFARRYAGGNLGVRAITWYDRKGFVEHRFAKNGRVTRKDFRK